MHIFLALLSFSRHNQFGGHWLPELVTLDRVAEVVMTHTTMEQEVAHPACEITVRHFYYKQLKHTYRCTTFLTVERYKTPCL